MRLPIFHLVVVATVLLLAISSSLSSAASVEEAGTSRSCARARSKQQSQTPTNNSTEGNQEERVSLSSVKNLFGDGTNALKKMKQARAAAKQARATIKQAEAETKLLKQMQSDKGIGEIFKNAHKAWNKDIRKGKLDKDIPIDESLKRVLDKADGNEKYLFKVFGALRKSKVSQDDVFYTLNIANSKTYGSFYSRYSTYLSDFGHRVV